MALQVWLPLTKDTRNQGLCGDTLTESGISFSDGGKLGGKYLSAGTITIPAATSKKIFNKNNMSFAFWLYPIGTSDSGAIMGQTSMATGDNRMYTIFQYSTPNNLHLSWQDNTATNSATFLGGQWSNFFPADTWTHCCITYDGSKAIIYRNGIQYATANGTSNRTSFEYNFPINGSSLRKLNDVRIYDHCLSLMEVKELSKGLILHYPLNRGGWGQENLLKGTQLLDIDATIPSGVTETANAYQGFTSVTYNNSSGTSYHELLAWNSKVTVKSEEIYTVSFYAKSPTSAILTCYFYNNTSGVVQVLTGRASTGAITLATDGNIPIKLTPTWTKYWITWTFDDTNTSATKSLLFRSLAGYGEMSVCGIKLEKGSIATPWCPNSSDALATTMGLNETTEYDCSGYCNNGTLWAYDTGGAITYTSDTSKYQVSTYINSDNNTTNTASGSRYIYGNCELTAPQYLTVAFWCKPIAGYGSSTGQGQFSLTNNAIGASAGQDYDTCPMNHRDNVIDMCTSSGTHKTVSIAFTANEWHHYVIVYDGRYGRVYKDGVATGATLDMGSVLPLKDMKGAVIGFSKAGGVWRSNKSYFSDFRIYATALSADDVKSLYQNSAYIDSSGNVYGAVHEEN